jgi:hypothetical protein
MRSLYGSMRSAAAAGRPASVASLSSGLAQHAKTLVNSMKDFNCNGSNDRNDPIVEDELQERKSAPPRGRLDGKPPPPAGLAAGLSISASGSSSASHSRYNSYNNFDRSKPTPTSSRSFREYSKSPQRVDI